MTWSALSCAQRPHLQLIVHQLCTKIAPFPRLHNPPVNALAFSAHPRRFRLIGWARSIFRSNREMNKKHPPSGSKSELCGDLLKDLGPASALSSWVDPFDSFRAPRFAKTGSGLRPCVFRSGLAGKPFTKQVRQHLPRKRSGDECVQYAVEPAWNDSGAVFDQTAEALRYALLDAHRFHRHSLRIEGELFEHRCVRNPGCQHSDVDT